MLNFFKNLFGSGDTEDQADGNGYATTAAPAAPVQVHARTVPTQKTIEPQAYRSAPPAPPVPSARPMANGSGVQLPLYTIIAVLPLELKTRIRQSMVADIFISLPLDRVLGQLATGSVKISFGELRELAPNVFTTQMDLDQTEVSLPLNEILPQINPAMLPRRQSQRHIQLPEDVHGPFGNDFSGVSLADPRTPSRVNGSAPTPAPMQTQGSMSSYMPTPAAAPVAREPRISPAPMAPAPIAPVPMAPRPVPMAPPPMTPPPAAARAPVQPSFQPPPLRPSAPIAFTPPPAPVAPAPAPMPDPIPMMPFRSSITSTPTPRPPTAPPSVSPPVRPVMPAARGVGATPLPSTAARLPITPTNGNGGNGNGNGRPTMPHPAQAAPAMPEVFLSVPLAVLTESWPEVLRGEIVQLNLAEAHLAMPIRLVEPSLKQGKIAFSWKMLRSWIRPATLPTVSAHDGMMLELPLRVIAPLFLARQRQNATVQQKVQVNNKIPNLFFGFPQPESAPAAVEMPVAPTPLPMAAPAPETEEENFAPAPKPVGPLDTNFYVWNESGDLPEVDESAVKKTSPGTDFLTRYATPNEVVARASALEGVVGALVALPDGLMVASKLAADLNGDTLAAFLPHIFGKVSQCTKELRMGELNNLHFTVGNVPWKIFRVNAIFFAAFGNAGQPLPTAQLAALAAQLDRKK